MAIEIVGVIGTGVMGAGIMQVAAQAGCTVIGQDIKQEFLDNGDKTIARMLKFAVRRPLPGQKALTQEEADAAKARISFTLEPGGLAQCDLIIEAAVERMDIKQQIFGNLDKLCKPETILASNTSSLSIAEMASATGRADRFCGMHYFNPPQAMELVEVIRTDDTSDATYEAVKAFCEACGKRTILARDTPGFIVNFLLMPYLLHAVDAYDEGLATKEDIDLGMRLGCGHPMGPLELIDTIGLDVALHVAESIYAALPKPQYAPPKLLQKLVSEGKLGKKSPLGGFYPK